MSQSESLSVVGAALHEKFIAQHADWLVDKQRDLEVQDFFHADVLNGDWKPLAREIKGHLQHHKGRLGILGPFWGFSLSTEDPDVRQVVKKRLSQGLDVCEELGATQMVVHSPFTTWDWHNLDNDALGVKKLHDRVHLAMDDAVARAEKLGVTLVIENIEDIDPDARVDLAQSFESDRVRVSIDTGHTFYAHGSTSAPPVDYYIGRAGNLLEHIHLQDADGHADRHWALGDGSIAWRSIFRALSQLTSKPRLIIELRDCGEVIRSAEYLQSLGLVE